MKLHGLCQRLVVRARSQPSPQHFLYEGIALTRLRCHCSKLDSDKAKAKTRTDAGAT